MQMYPKCFIQVNFLVAKLTGQMLILKLYYQILVWLRYLGWVTYVGGTFKLWLLILFYTNHLCPRMSLKEREAGCQFAKHEKSLLSYCKGQILSFAVCFWMSSIYTRCLVLRKLLSGTNKSYCCQKIVASWGDPLQNVVLSSHFNSGYGTWYLSS